MAGRRKDVAVGSGLAAAALASALVVPSLAARLGLDPAAPDVQFALFFALLAPALVAGMRVLGLVQGGAVPCFAYLCLLELIAGSALISSWAPLIALSALAALLSWLAGRLGIRSPGSASALLSDLLVRLQRLFGEELVGVYLYGSAVAGDFDPGRSDVDLVVACAGGVEGRLPELGRLHRDLVRAHPEWDDRVDAIYVPVDALRAFRERSFPIAVISPGEPLHLTETSPKWAMNWHLVREQGVALLGPPPGTLIPVTTSEDFVASVRAHLSSWPEWIAASDRPGFRAYAVLTMCRALHACRRGRQASKREAARWAEREYPAWAGLIGSAVAWLDAPAGGAEVPDAAPFVDFAIREARG